jgi:glycosyltransferase involved in cell wall biosynthesis
MEPLVAKRPYVLSVGRLAPYKGTDLLLMAFAGLERRDLDLVLCGAPFHGRHYGPLIEALRLTDRVRLTGLVAPRRVRALLEGCLFYAAAPRVETFGMAVMEALAAGKAVVATAAGALPEYLNNERNALLVSPKDVAGLSRAMDRLASSASLRARLGRAGKKTAARFTWKRAARSYLEAYRSIS